MTYRHTSDLVKLQTHPLVSAPIRRFPVDSFGAIPDGKTDNSKAFLAAAAAVAQHGAGAELYAPGPGVYLTLPFALTASGTGIRVASGASVKAVCDFDHWPKTKEFPS